MIKMSFGTLVCFAAIFVIMKIAQGEPFPSFYSWDFVALLAFIGFMYWLLRDRKNAGDSPDGQSTDKSIAFRLGKALNRVLFRNGRSA